MELAQVVGQGIDQGRFFPTKNAQEQYHQPVGALF